VLSVNEKGQSLTAVFLFYFRSDKQMHLINDDTDDLGR